jgi:hypothetical protein
MAARSADHGKQDKVLDTSSRRNQSEYYGFKTSVSSRSIRDVR